MALLVTGACQASAKAGQGYPFGMPNIKLVDVVSQQGAGGSCGSGHPRGDHLGIMAP